jgi:FkbM family methyltransferase
MIKLMESVKTSIGKHEWLAELIKPAYYSIPLRVRSGLGLSDHRTELEFYLRPLLNPSTYFIKIGAYDGVTGDPIVGMINRYKWSGIMVEPVKYIYDNLSANYADRPNISLENIAIADRDGYKDFYYLRESDDPGLPIWYNQVGSFYLDHILKLEDLIPNVESYLVSQPVQCLTFASLIDKYQPLKLDLIHIDTEGYDYEVIKLIDFHRVKPHAILYEQIHLKNGMKEESVAYLQGYGYSTIEIGNDILAYLPEGI